MNLLSILLQAAEEGAGNPFGQFGGLIFFVLIFVVFYFFMIRPQQKKQKEIQKARDMMKVGDKVILAGGIHGKIREVKDTTFIVEVAENVRLKVEKASVYGSAEDSVAEQAK